jgi:BirA family biotin operon repressor/biotin-[acetyl-CoA-carboxylase] ligase
MCAERPRAEPARSVEPAGPGGEVPFTTVPGPAGTRFGPVRRFAEIDSTNRYLLDAARAGAPEGAVAVADYQRAGRGRLGRRWEAPPGSNLLVSVLLRPRLAVEELHLCTVAVALAATAACEQGAGVVPDLKWPNDLMVGGRKLGGILAEALPAGTGLEGEGSTTPAVVVGLGLNVGWPPPDAAPGSGDGRSLSSEQAEVVGAATSISRQVPTSLEPLALLALILEQLEPRLADLDDRDGRRRLTSEYRRRCNTVGSKVRVTLPGEVFTGTATDITAEGHLIVDVGPASRTVAAGDVVHLRDHR